MDEKNIDRFQKEMIEMEKAIDRLEKDLLGSFGNLGTLQVRLRHRVMFIHTLIEHEIDMLLVNYSLKPLENEKNKKPQVESMFRMLSVTEDMDFVKKLNLAQKLGLLKGRKNAFNEIMDVNTIRKQFSHPKAHNKELAQYITAAGYVEGLKKLIKGYRTIFLLRYKVDPFST